MKPSSDVEGSMYIVHLFSNQRGTCVSSVNPHLIVNQSPVSV